MKGNYHEEEPQMKFTVESSLTSRVYQTQKYIIKTYDNSELQSSYSLAGAFDTDTETLS